MPYHGRDHRRELMRAYTMEKTFCYTCQRWWTKLPGHGREQCLEQVDANESERTAAIHEREQSRRTTTIWGSDDELGLADFPRMARDMNLDVRARPVESGARAAAVGLGGVVVGAAGAATFATAGVAHTLRGVVGGTIDLGAAGVRKVRARRARRQNDGARGSDLELEAATLAERGRAQLRMGLMAPVVAATGVGACVVGAAAGAVTAAGGAVVAVGGAPVSAVRRMRGDYVGRSDW